MNYLFIKYNIFFKLELTVRLKDVSKFKTKSVIESKTTRSEFFCDIGSKLI